MATRPKKRKELQRIEPVSKRRGGAKQKYDWDLLRMQFVEGYPEDASNPEDGNRDWPNLRELSDRTSVPYERIRERSALERWMDLRSAYQRKVARERQDSRIKFLAKQAVSFDDRALDMSKIGMRLIMTRLAEIAKEAGIRQKIRDRALEDIEAGLPIDRTALFTAVRSSEMMELARAAQTWQDIGMKAMGTDVDRHVLDINTNTIETTISITAELERDDPDRLASFAAAMDRAGLFELLENENDVEGEDQPETDGEDIVDAEVVEGDEHGTEPADETGKDG